MTPEASLRFRETARVGSVGTAIRRSPDLDQQVEQAVSRSTEWFLSVQAQDGYWWGELEADTTLESDYILYLHILGSLQSDKIPKLANYIRQRQLPDGGWNIFYGGPSELNATVKAYVALRLAGDAADAPASGERAARKCAGAGRSRSDEFLHAILSGDGRRGGLGHVPAIPPELMLLPNWFPSTFTRCLRGRAES